MRIIQYILLGLLLVITRSGWSASYTIAAIHTKTEESVIDIEYPQGFNDHIDLKIRKIIDRLKEPFVNNSPAEEYPEKEWNQEWLRDNIKVNFKVKFLSSRAISILFNIQRYGRGAAHPVDSIKTVNFFDGEEIRLEQLFKPDNDYLSVIAHYSYKGLLKRNIPNEPELKSGTNPLKSNYNKWFFSKRGLVFVFECYQITGYINGPEMYFVIPDAIFKSLLRYDIGNTIWSDPIQASSVEQITVSPELQANIIKSPLKAKLQRSDGKKFIAYLYADNVVIGKKKKDTSPDGDLPNSTAKTGKFYIYLYEIDSKKFVQYRTKIFSDFGETMFNSEDELIVLSGKNQKQSDVLLISQFGLSYIDVFEAYGFSDNSLYLENYVFVDKNKHEETQFDGLMVSNPGSDRLNVSIIHNEGFFSLPKDCLLEITGGDQEPGIIPYDTGSYIKKMYLYLSKDRKLHFEPELF